MTQKYKFEIDHGELTVTPDHPSHERDDLFFVVDLKIKSEPTIIDTYFGLTREQAITLSAALQNEIEKADNHDTEI